MDTVSSRASLLSLPHNIRKRIYVFTDLIRDCPITILPWSPAPSPAATDLVSRPTSWTLEECAYQVRKRGLPHDLYSVEHECYCPDLPKQLLLICKSIHGEVQELLYGENKFIIRSHQQAEDLKVFMTLPIGGIKALRHLSVRLNSWPCVRGHNLSNTIRGNCMVCPVGLLSSKTSASDPEVCAGDSLSESIINEWMEICQRLTDHVAPGTLHLEFICDVGDLTTADYVITPLKSLPCLKHCSIRLGRRVDYTLRSLAKFTALRLTKKLEITNAAVGKIKTPATTFSSLPREIRLRILWFTNLGPGGSFLDGLEKIEFKSGERNHATYGYDKSRAVRTCCLGCSFTKLHCSCPLNFASYSSSCSCRILPLELFLVDRQMYLDATEIFYSTNIFQFQGPFLETQYIIESIPSSSLRQIRQVRLDMGGFNAFQRGQYQLEWRSFLSFINTHFEISRLCLGIDFTEDIYDFDDPGDLYEALEEVYDGYIMYIQAIRGELTGLLDLHIDLGVLCDLEPVLEKYIMGPTYDSTKGNRYSKPKSMVFSENADPRFYKIPPWHREL